MMYGILQHSSPHKSENQGWWFSRINIEGAVLNYWNKARHSWSRIEIEKSKKEDDAVSAVLPEVLFPKIEK